MKTGGRLTARSMDLFFFQLDLTLVAVKDMPELIIRFIKGLIELESLKWFLI
jgi:hypothetical protein